MKTFKKRISVINDGLCNRKKPAALRAEEAMIRYVAKRMKTGWIPTFVCGGNEFSQYANYVTMCLPKKEKERNYLQSQAVDNGWQIENNICVGRDYMNSFWK